MYWTKDKPDEDGFYWVRSSARDIKPIVVRMLFGDIFVPGESYTNSAAEFGRAAQWCRIPEPEENTLMRCHFKRTKTQSSSEILRPDAAAEFLGISKPTLYRWAKEMQSFPRQVHIGPRIGGWRKEELNEWLATR